MAVMIVTNALTRIAARLAARDVDHSLAA